MTNPWKQKIPRSQNESKESNEQRETRTRRFRTCRLQELVCCLCRRSRCRGDNIESELLEEERERTTPIVAFHCGFLAQENADTFPILIFRDSRYGQTGATCCDRKGPTAYFIPFLVGFIKDLAFRRIILKCDTAPSTKALQDAVIHACVGVEVIPQGPLEGGHMANGRVEMTVREVKRQC